MSTPFSNKLLLKPAIPNKKPIYHPGPPTPYITKQGAISSYTPIPNKGLPTDFARRLTNDELVAYNEQKLAGKILKNPLALGVTPPLKVVQESIDTPIQAPPAIKVSPTKPVNMVPIIPAIISTPTVYRDAMGSPVKTNLYNNKLIVVGVGGLLLVVLIFIISKKD